MHPVNKLFEWYKKCLKSVDIRVYFKFISVFVLFSVEVTNSDVNANDFEEVIDEKTGEKVLRMKKDVAQRKGFIDMDTVEFEYKIDEKTGQRIVQIKNMPGKSNKGNVSFEMFIDPITGQQTLRMKQEVEVKCKKRGQL